MNSVWCETIGKTAAYLIFGRELRTINNVISDDNFVPQKTPYLEKLANAWQEANEINEEHQYRQKSYTDKR